MPKAYLEVLDLGNNLFPPLYEFENGLRLVVNNFLSTCYGIDWWETSLKYRLRQVYDYSLEQNVRRNAMPWLGASQRVQLLPIHLVTLGQLEQIVVHYQADCIPTLFPSIHFFLGHLEVIKRVRNFYSHMFPCMTDGDCRTARREIKTLAEHINLYL